MFRIHPRHGLVLLTTVALALAIGLLPPAVAEDTAQSAPPIPTERLEGDSRFGTAAAVVRSAFTSADTVYIAPGGQFGYALAGGPRALRDSAPVLLTDGTRIPQETSDELERLTPSDIVVVGGQDVVPDSVVTALGEHGTVRRIAGVGAVGTAAEVALDGWPDGAQTVYLATSRDFPDALAGGVAATVDDAPILLTDPAYLSAETVSALQELQPDFIRLLGGTAAISDDVALQIGEVTDAAIGRLAGPGRIETALSISGAINPMGQAIDTVWIATAENFPDAMAATPAIASGDGALVLTRRRCLPYIVRDEIARLAPDRLIVLGGTAAVSDEAAALQPCDEMPPAPTFAVVSSESDDELAPIGDSGPRPVAAIIDESGVSTALVENEVLVSAPDDDDFQQWLVETGGEVLQTAPAAGFLPETHLVRLSSGVGEFSQQQVAELAEDLQWINGVATGHHEVTSPVVLDTLSTATAAVADGMTIGLNVVVDTDDVLDGEIAESQHPGTIVDSSNPFTWNQFNDEGLPGIGTAEAWRLLAANGRDQAEVSMTVIDAGFAATYRDYPPDVAGDGVPNTDCDRPSDGCRWHGTHVTTTATGQLNNGWGAVGSAGPIRTTVRQYTMTRDIFTTIVVPFASMAAEGFPDIVNMSLGDSVPALLTPFTAPLDLVTLGAHLIGDVVIVAAAGNDRTDINRTDCFLLGPCWEERKYMPCELAGVYCVGGLIEHTRDRDEGSNYGVEACENPVCGVKIFAPYTVIVGASPEGGQDGLQKVTGTSFASPYVAGVFALIKAANPGLSATELITLMNQTASTSSHPHVGRVVNAYGAVLTALGPDAIIPVGPNRTPSPFPQDPVPAVGFSSALSTDQGTLRGDGTTPDTQPTVQWISTLPGTEYWNDHPFAGLPLVAGQTVVMPVVDPSVPDRTPYEMSLVGLDARSGGRRWKLDDIAAGCPPVVGRDGLLWAVRGRNESDIRSWEYTLLGIDAATGRVKRVFATPLDQREGEGGVRLGVRDCDGHPLRMSPDGTRLLMWQGEKLSHADHSAMRILDITAVDVIETAYLHMDGTAEGGAASRNNPDNGWVYDIRVSPDRPTIYLMEREQGADPEDVHDDRWRLLAVDLPGVSRQASLTDDVRMVTLPVGFPDIGSWVVVGDEIIISGEELESGRRRSPADGSGVASRRFRVVDDGTGLEVAARHDIPIGTGGGRAEVMGLSESGALLTVTDAFRLEALDMTTLGRTWEVVGGTFGPAYTSLLVDAEGNAVHGGTFSESIDSTTPTGDRRWSFALRTDDAVHPYASPLGADTFDFRHLDRIRLAGVTPDGQILLTGVSASGITVVSLR